MQSDECEVKSSEGVDMGTYEAATADEAYALFCKDAGYASVEAAEAVAPKSVTVTEVE